MKPYKRVCQDQNNMGPSRAINLKIFAKVMRGIATGANEFFFLSTEQAKDLEISNEYLKLAVGRTRDVLGSSLNKKILPNLNSKVVQHFYFLSPVTPKLARQFKTI